MKRNQRFSFVLLLCLFGLGLSIQACQQTSADTNSPSIETQAGRQQSGAGQSGPFSQELDKIGKPESSSSSPDEGEIREVTYIAEKITPVPAQLVSKDPDSRINVRSQPSTRSKAKHFGYKGDAVTLLQTAKGEGDAIWYYLRFNQSQAEGWIREDFIAQSTVSLLPRQDYRPYNFEADPWLASFNQTYAAAQQRQESWLADAPTVALKLSGFPSSGECKPTEVKTTNYSASKVTVVIKSGQSKREACSDDSVLASQIRVDLVKENQIWAIEWAGGRYLCHQGRGQQDFAPALCR
ncbi:SH3 domain-containing protein [Acaryochloris marina]|uniref:SH3b domain-containing protein n=1 Tax=Acaryochloris marina (strain MBIC 11017) TaxID=329726 RepID=B0CFB3_ACAM1|nr:SH3 domain-containing protein [Acaryochloris marina]ABW25800.1 hypothetical protein AM1_0756 [Acaryochloris marina MBIC11017]BDM80667.1 hypothetical protein AM10699_35350 [Acaryochloris marina MBIC10699]